MPGAEPELTLARLSKIEQYMYWYRVLPVGIACDYIPKGDYGWMWVGGAQPFVEELAKQRQLKS